jgi:hypothetical protein
MLQTKDIIHVQRLLLLSKGYTENMLYVTGQPKLFLSNLSGTLNVLERDRPAISAPQVFTHRMVADFENGRFPVELDFTYQYLASKKDLALISLKASLFDVHLFQSMVGKPSSELMGAQTVLKLLREKLLIAIQKDAAEYIKARASAKVRHRFR